MPNRNSSLVAWVPASTGNHLDGPETAFLKQKARNVFVLIHRNRSRWGTWRHLNDMRAGCEHQRAMGWKSYDEHPSEPCPVCGYKYGTAWLVEPLPAEVYSFVESLPEA